MRTAPLFVRIGSRKLGLGLSIHHFVGSLLLGVGRSQERVYDLGRDEFSRYGPGTAPFAPLRELPPLPAPWRSLPAAFVHSVRRHPSKTALADSTGATLTYGDSFLRALVLGRVLSRSWGNATHLGLMVPPTVPAAVANLAVSLWGKIPVNLNYSASQEVWSTPRSTSAGSPTC